jgi:Chemotaxis protein histidine kinase and related kinases
MLDMFIFETTQNIEQLEVSILDAEKSSCYTQAAINEIFRIMHTIKGSSAMMLFNEISVLAHSMEDLFYFLREKKPKIIDCSALSDLVLEGVDFIKVELQKIKNGDKADGNAAGLIDSIKEFLKILKGQNNTETEVKKPVTNEQPHFYIAPDTINKTSQNLYKATIFFENGCEMENIRAYTVVHNLKEVSDDVHYLPRDIIDNDDSVREIREKGFRIYIRTDKSFKEVNDFLNKTIFLKDLELSQLEDEEELKQFNITSQMSEEASPIKVPQFQNKAEKEQVAEKEFSSGPVNQSIISVNVAKLDKLMDLVGEMVIAEAMVTQNPDLIGLQIDNFQKAARQLHKITSELQDTVMSIRMVPLATTFQKMHRVVRDMSKKLNKDVELELIGEETEVDKNIIEHISDPLMHLVRNSIDHGLEAVEDREAFGKNRVGTITMEAKNAGSDVLVIVRDDGRGLNKEKILKRAKENGILTRPENEIMDKEIYNLIFLPGFSTKDAVSEFSGRGVGMDVVVKNIETVGGSVSVDSVEGVGTTITMKIPLTLAIIDGMNIRVGNSRYTIPTTAIKESFRPKGDDIIKDPDDNEMIMVRGQCYPIIRLYEHYKVETDITDCADGIFVMVEENGKSVCLFADELLGQQQVVVKALPVYIKNIRKIQGIAGCTLLGDGSISLILDIGSVCSNK